MPASNNSFARGSFELSLHARCQLRRISRRAPASTSSFAVFSHRTSCSRIPNSLSRSRSCASLVGNRSGSADGSSTIWAKITARAAASGRRAHQRCSVLGWPCRMDFSRLDAALIASRGKATSMSFLRVTVMGASDP